MISFSLSLCLSSPSKSTCTELFSTRRSREQSSSYLCSSGAGRRFGGNHSFSLFHRTRLGDSNNEAQKRDERRRYSGERLISRDVLLPWITVAQWRAAKSVAKVEGRLWKTGVMPGLIDSPVHRLLQYPACTVVPCSGLSSYRFVCFALRSGWLRLGLCSLG